MKEDTNGFIPTEALLAVIDSIQDKGRLEAYVHDTLGKLTDYDEKHHADSLSFLETWIRYSGNVPKITEELYLHRNTVHYRINKVKEILGYDDLDYAAISNLWFAFLVRQVLHREKNEENNGGAL